MEIHQKNKETANDKLSTALHVECVCVPSEPFYVRWLNRFGGVDYWMFQMSQTYTRSLDKQEDFIPYIVDTFTARGTNRSLSKEASEKAVVGAENLSDNEWYELSRIPFSPMIQMYDGDRDIWFDILPQKAENDMITSDGAHAVEFEFLLPQPQLQQ